MIQRLIRHAIAHHDVGDEEDHKGHTHTQHNIYLCSIFCVVHWVYACPTNSGKCTLIRDSFESEMNIRNCWTAIGRTGKHPTPKDCVYHTKL